MRTRKLGKDGSNVSASGLEGRFAGSDGLEPLGQDLGASSAEAVALEASF